MTGGHQLEGCSLWENHPDAILLVGRQPRPGMHEERLFVHDLNPRAESLFGYDSGAVIGGPVERFVPSVRLLPSTPALPAALPGPGRGTTDVFRAWRKDGSAFPASVAISTLGPPDFLDMVVIRDVSELVDWRDGLPAATKARLEQLRVREAALEATRETLAQHLFAAGLAVRQLNTDGGPETQQRLEQAVAVLDEVMTNLIAGV